MQSPGGSKKVQATADPIKVKADTVRAAVQAMLLVGKSASSGTASALNPGNTINGVLFTGAAPITITATNPHALTLGSGLSGTSYDGSAAVTATVTSAPVLSPGAQINGVNFTGASNITVAAAAGTLTGTTLASNVVASSLTSVGTLTGLTVSGTAAFTNASPFSVVNGQTLTVSVTAQTVGAATLTIPNFASVSDTFAFVTLAQTLANKTLASSCVVPASTLTGNIAYAALPTGSGTWDTGAATTLTISRGVTINGTTILSLGLIVGTDPGGPQILRVGGAIHASGAVAFDSTAVIGSTITVTTGNINISAGGVTSNQSSQIQWDSANSTAAVTHTSTVGGSSGGCIYIFRSANGTIAVPTATASSDKLGEIDFDGYTGSGYLPGARIIASATQAWSVGANGSQIQLRTVPNGSASVATVLTLGQDQSTSFGPSAGAIMSSGGVLTKYDAVSTAGLGVSPIYASGRVTAKTNATSGTVCTYTPAADGTFTIYANVNVTTSTTFSFTVTCTYTDEGGTARTQTFSFAQVGGAPIQTLTNVTGAGTYDGFPLTIRAKGANAITILTAPAGTYTAVVYNISGAIAQLAA